MLEIVAVEWKETMGEGENIEFAVLPVFFLVVLPKRKTIPRPDLSLALPLWIPFAHVLLFDWGT